MMNSIKYISIVILACSLIDSIMAGCCNKEIEYQFLEYATFDHCEGKDSGNYTLINQYTRDSTCALNSMEINQRDLLLSSSSSSKQTNVNMLKILASQANPNGALVNIDILYLVTGGALEAKYVYFREVLQELQYLKVCSSILGYSYVSSKSSILLISEKLDLNILIAPSGAFELFKKGCSTVCHGNSIAVGPTAIIQRKD